MDLPEVLWSVVALFAHDVRTLASVCTAAHQGARGVVDVKTPHGTTRRVQVSPVVLHVGVGFMQEQHVVVRLGDGSIDFFFATLLRGPMRLASVAINVGELCAYVECEYAHLTRSDVVVQGVSLLRFARRHAGQSQERVRHALQHAPLRYDAVVLGL